MVRTLLKKQLMEIFRSYFYDTKRNRARSKASIIGYLLLFALLMFGFLGGTFFSMGKALCAPLLEAGTPWLYFVIFSLIAALLGIFGSVFTTYTGLYLAKDNDLLFSLPIPARSIIAARLLGVYLMGLLYTAVVIVPGALVYLLTAPFTPGALLGSLLLVFLLSVFVLALSCLLGWVVAKLSLRLKNKSVMTVLISLAFIALYYFGYFKAMNWVQELVANAALYGERVRQVAPALYRVGSVGTGDALSALLCTAAAALLLALVWLLLSRSFFAVATASAPSGTVKKGIGVLRQKSADAALLGKELARLGSSANYILNCALGAILLPLAGLLLLLRGKPMLEALQGVFGGMEGAVTVLLVAMLCMLASMIDAAVASVSLEGKSVWIPRSLPVAPWQVLRAKLRVQLLLAAPALLFGSLCALIALKPSALEALMLLIVPQCYALLFALLGLFLDLRRGNLNWTNELAPIKQSFNVFFVLFGGWLYAIALAALFLLLEPPFSGAVYLALFAAATLLVCLLLYRYLKTRGGKLFMEL